jgi:beta-galactosidase
MFIYGTQYFRPPNPPSADWARDLARIKAHAFNTVKFWIPWTWVHQANDEFDLSDLDRLMELAEQNQLQIVLNIILENAPYWLEEQHPEARYRAHDGTTVKLTGAINTPCGGWPGLCLDNEPIREQAGRVLRTVVERYKRHPLLFGIDVWNEPHSEPTWYYPDKMFCYCDASVTRFRAWLESKYGDLDGLNRAWARRYSSWSQVSPPTAFEVYPDMLDWKRFWLENLQSWLKFKVGIARQADPTHPVITHAASSGYLGTLTVNTWDEWLLAEPVDIFGTSAFPKWLMHNDPAEYTFHLDMIRSASRKKPFWQAELQGGHGRDIGYTRTPHPTPAEIRMWNWSVLASGGKGLMYWCWRPELLGPESPGYALCNVAGDPSPRAVAAAEMARQIQAEPVLATSQPVESGNAILISRDTAILNYAGDRNMLLYAKALMGAYRAFYDRNIPVSFVHTDNLRAAVTDRKYNFIYFPMPFVLDRSTADALKEFVAEGGTLVAEACPGHYTESGWCATQIPGQGLDELFGVQEIETDQADRIEIQPRAGFGDLGEGTVLGHLYREQLATKSSSTQVVGVYSDGTPAITNNPYGQGSAYLIGTMPSVAYEAERTSQASGFITHCSQRYGLHAHIEPAHESIKTRLHRYDEGYLVFVLNWGTEDKDVRIWIDETRHTTGTTDSTPIVEPQTLCLKAMSGALVKFEG